MEKFGKRGAFYRDAFTEFSNQDLMDFFKNHGLKLKVEEEGRVFPITEKAKSVVDVLENVLDECSVKILYNYRLNGLHKRSKIFKLSSEVDELITAHKVVIATGGLPTNSQVLPGMDWTLQSC